MTRSLLLVRRPGFVFADLDVIVILAKKDASKGRQFRVSCCCFFACVCLCVCVCLFVCVCWKQTRSFCFRACCSRTLTLCYIFPVCFSDVAGGGGCKQKSGTSKCVPHNGRKEIAKKMGGGEHCGIVVGIFYYSYYYYCYVDVGDVMESRAKAVISSTDCCSMDRRQLTVNCGSQNALCRTAKFAFCFFKIV